MRIITLIFLISFLAANTCANAQSVGRFKLNWPYYDDFEPPHFYTQKPDTVFLGTSNFTDLPFTSLKKAADYKFLYILESDRKQLYQGIPGIVEFTEKFNFTGKALIPLTLPPAVYQNDSLRLIQFAYDGLTDEVSLTSGGYQNAGFGILYTTPDNITNLKSLRFFLAANNRLILYNEKIGTLPLQHLELPYHNGFSFFPLSLLELPDSCVIYRNNLIFSPELDVIQALRPDLKFTTKKVSFPEKIQFKSVVRYTFRDALSNQEVIMKYPNGKLKAKGWLFGGKPHGEWVFYHDNGNQYQVRSYNQGIPWGQWMSWSKTGKLLFTTKFDHFSSYSRHTYYPDITDTTVSRIDFETFDGLLDGEMRYELSYNDPSPPSSSNSQSIIYRNYYYISHHYMCGHIVNTSQIIAQNFSCLFMFSKGKLRHFSCYDSSFRLVRKGDFNKHGTGISEEYFPSSTDRKTIQLKYKKGNLDQKRK
jgi:antitoxin component YwqK of YwqJK toxin-antitoxin module